ncbi:MAG TPA: DUF5134 domain-containing protein [Trebonia sp.]|nr:DUF5134 domain-containing protein [Trebonia sp.]
MPPAWLTDIFAALMLVVAAVSAARLAAARPWQPGAVIPDTDIAHLLMGIAMAGMLASSLTTLPNAAWEVIFALLTVWFAYRVARDARASGIRALASGHCAPHLVHSAAMLYMFLAVKTAASGSMAGMSGSAGSAMQALAYPTLAFIFALILIGYTAWDLDQLPGFRPGLAAMVAPSHQLAVAASVAGTGDAGISTTRTPPASSAGTGPEVADGASGHSGAAVLLSPGTTVGCRIAMGVTMALMLFLMI